MLVDACCYLIDYQVFLVHVPRLQEGTIIVLAVQSCPCIIFIHEQTFRKGKERYINIANFRIKSNITQNMGNHAIT